MKENETSQTLEECCLERLKQCNNMEEAISIVEFYNEKKAFLAALRDFVKNINKNER